MSAYVKQETVINDESLLLEALKKKGYEVVEVCKTPQALVSYTGDFRTADGRGHTHDADKAMKADIIIRRIEVNKKSGGASNDIGFRKGENGNYEALISDYDRGKHNKEWLDSLKTEYGVLKAKKVAKKAGMTLVKETVKNGKPVLQFMVRN